MADSIGKIQKYREQKRIEQQSVDYVERIQLLRHLEQEGTQSSYWRPTTPYTGQSVHPLLGKQRRETVETRRTDLEAQTPDRSQASRGKTAAVKRSAPGEGTGSVRRYLLDFGTGPDSRTTPPAIADRKQENALPTVEQLRTAAQLRAALEAEESPAEKPAGLTPVNPLRGTGGIEEFAKELKKTGAFDHNAAFHAFQNAAQKPGEEWTLRQEWGLQEKEPEKAPVFPEFQRTDLTPGTEAVPGVDTIPYGASRLGARWNAGDYLKAAGNAAWGTMSTLSNSIVNTVKAVDSLAAQGFSALTGHETGPVLKPVYDFYESLDADTQKKVEEDIQAGRMNGMVYNLLSGLVQQIPTIAIGLLTGGTSAAGQAAGAVSSNSSALAAGIKQLPELFKNPQFLWSFIQSFGGTYGDAVKNGANPAQAFLAGVVDALPESAIEVGGGLESAMAEGPATNWKDFAKRWIRSAAEEAGEEIRQDPFSGLAQMTYDPDMTIFSLTDQEAVLNPVRAAESAAAAFLTTLISGGVGTGVRSYQAIQDAGRQVIDSGNTNTLLSAALDSADGTIRSRAVQLIQRQMEGKEPSVTDVGRLAWDAANAQNASRIGLEPEKPPKQVENRTASMGVRQNETAAAAEPEAVKLKPPPVKTAKPQADGAAGEPVSVSMAERLGESGKMAYQYTLEHSGIEEDGMRPAFLAYYHYGLAGSDIKNVPSEFGMVLDPESAQRAWYAGQNDRAAGLNQTSGKAVSGKGGLVQSRAARTVDSRTRAAVDAAARLAGVQVVFDGNLSESTNGYFDGQAVHLNPKSQRPLLSVLNHEVTHHIQEASPELYRQYRDYVISYLTKKDMAALDELVQKQIRAYDGQGRSITYEQALDEVASDASDQFLRDESAVRRLARENRSLGQKVLDAIRDVIGKIKAALKGEEVSADAARILQEDLKAFEEAEDLWIRALASARDGENSVDIGEKSEDTKRVKYSLNPDFAAEYDTWDKKSTGGYFRIGRTSEVLQSIGVKDSAIYWDKSKIKKILHDHPEMTDDVIKQVPELLEHPVIVMQSQTVANRIVLLGEATAANGDTVLTALELRPDGKQNKILDFVKVTSAHGRTTNALQYLLDTSDILYLDPNKKRTDSWLEARRLQLPVGLTNYGSIASVTYTDRNVKGELSFGDHSGKTAMQLALEKALGTGSSDTSISEKDENDTGKERYSFAGAEALTADQSQAKKAVQMEKEGADGETIRQETGWFRGADGNWRFEIDDSKAKIHLEKVKLNGYIRLGDILEHDSLYAAYPQLKEIRVRIADSVFMSGKNAVFDLQQNDINLNELLLDDLEAMKKVLLHEVEHGIQMLEGFANGSNVSRWEQELAKGTRPQTRRIREAEAVLRELSGRHGAEFAEDMAIYAELDGKEAEGYAEKLEKRYGKDWWDAARAARILRLSRETPESRTAEELYWDTAGEIEARDTAARSGLDTEARRRVKPDTGNPDTVFSDTGSRVFSIEKDSSGRDTVVIEQDIFEGKSGKSVRILQDYIKKCIGEVYAIIESGQPVYLGKDLPGEYTRSRYSQSLLRNHQYETLNVKGQAAQGLGEMIEIATNRRWEKPRHLEKHARDAKYGFYKYETRFAVPNKAGEGYDIYSAVLVIRNSEDGKKYLYDVIGIKKDNGAYLAHPPKGVGQSHARSVEHTTVLDSGTEASAPKGASQTPAQKGGVTAVSNQSIPQPGEIFKGDEKFSLAGTETAEKRNLLQENERLRKAVEALKGEFQLTKGVKFSDKAVDRLAGTILRAYSSKYDRKELLERLKRIFTYMEMDPDPNSFEKAYGAMAELSKAVLNESESIDRTLWDETKELRDRIRTTAVFVPEEDRGGFPEGFEAFRRENFGRLRLSRDGVPLDAFYQELSEEYPGYFPADVTAALDRLENLAGFSDAVRPRIENPYGMDLEEQAAEAAGRMFDAYFDIPQVKTFADKKREEMLQLKGKHRIEMEKFRAEAKERQKRAEEAARERLKNLRDQKNARVAEAIEAERQKAREAREKLRDSRAVRKYRERIARTALDLNRRLLNPTDKKHIPEELRQPVAAFLSSLDFSGEKQDTKTAEIWRDLQRKWADIAAGQSREDFSGEYLTIDPDLAPRLDELIQSGAPERLHDLNRAEMEELWKVTAAVKAAVTEADRKITEGKQMTAEEAGNRILADLQDRKPAKEKRGAASQWAADFFRYDMTDSIRFAEMFGPAMEELMQHLRSGHDVMVNRWNEAVAYTGELFGGRKVWEWGNGYAEPQSFPLKSGETIQLTPAQVMSLYLLNKREQARRHIYQGGIESGETVWKSRKRRKGSVKAVTESDVKKILESLTPEQREIADGLGQFLSGRAAEWGNEASMERFGYRKFTEKNYFPIRPDSDYTVSRADGMAREGTIAGLGMTKSTNKAASNPLVVEDVFETFSRHVTEMAAYNAFYNRLEDFQAVWNWRAKGFQSVKASLRQAGGEEANQYIRKLLTAVNGRASVERSAAESLLGKYKAGAIGGNLRVVVQQPTAYVRALTVMDGKYLLKGLAGKVDPELMKTYSPIARWKDWGYFETGNGKQLNELVLGRHRGADRFSDAAMWLPGQMDNLTWGRIWKACEYEIADTTQLEAGSEEFYQAVGKRFTEVIDKTQVVDSVFHRSQVMRSKNAMNQVVTAFMAEPTKAYNAVMGAVRRMQEARDAGEKKAAAKGVFRAVSAFVLTGVVNALTVSLMDAARDDDDGEEFAEKYRQALLGDSDPGAGAWKKIQAGLSANLTENLNPLGLLPYAKDILSLLEGFDVKRMDMQGAADLVASLGKWMKLGDSRYTAAYLVKDTAESLSKLTGVPIGNLMRELGSLINLTLMAADSFGADTTEIRYFLNRSMLDSKNSLNLGIFAGLILEARQAGNEELALEIYNDLVKNGWSNDKIDARLETLAKKQLEGAELVENYLDAEETGGAAGMESALDAAKEEGFSADEFLAAVNQERNRRGKEEKEAEVREEINSEYWSGGTDIYNYDTLYQAVLNGDAESETAIREALERSGKKPENIQNAVESRIREDLKEAFWESGSLEDVKVKRFRALLLKQDGDTDVDGYLEKAVWKMFQEKFKGGSGEYSEYRKYYDILKNVFGYTNDYIIREGKAG